MPRTSSSLGFSGLGVALGVAVYALAVPPHITAQRSAAAPVGQAVPRAGTSSPMALTAERVEAYAAAGRRRLDYLPGDVLVKFRPGVSVERQQRALGALRSRPDVSRLRWMGGIARLHDDSEPDATVLAATLAAQPEVEYAQPNYIRRQPGWASATAVRPVAAGRGAIGVAGTPDDPDFRDLQWNLSLLDMPAAWDINAGGDPSIVVAVIDTGVTTAATSLTRSLWTGQRFETVTLPFSTSPDLAASRLVSPRDEVFDPGSGTVLDFEGHGTHVASTIAEDTNNEMSLAGIAYNVRIMPVKVCVDFWALMLARAANNVAGYLPTSAGGCSDDAIQEGIRYAVDNGARIINLSLGGVDPAPAVRDALTYAVGKGAFVAVSMGNTFESGNEPEYPALYAPSIDGVMSVGAIGKSRTRAYYSNTGTHLEIVAPGGSDRDGGGDDEGYIWQVTLFPPDTDPLRTPVPRFDRYVEVGYIGTSMAAPHVSALAALLMSQGVTSPKAIEAAIKAFALDLGPKGKDEEFGFGLIQPRASLFGLGIR